jgi:prolyl oligopeptidase
MDMLRFHLFTIGWGWTSDYGSADDPASSGRSLPTRRSTTSSPGRAIPPTLVTTGDHDDRVVPGHSFKFAAGAPGGPGGRRAGDHPDRHRRGPRHGQAVHKLIDERADVLAFLELALGSN